MKKIIKIYLFIYWHCTVTESTSGNCVQVFKMTIYFRIAPPCGAMTRIIIIDFVPTKFSVTSLDNMIDNHIHYLVSGKGICCSREDKRKNKIKFKQFIL